MKFILEDEDKKLIDNYDYLVDHNHLQKWLEEGKTYGFEFEVVDENKANNFFLSVFHAGTDGDVTDFIKTTGIKITKLDYDTQLSNEAKDVLKKSLKEIENICKQSQKAMLVD